LISLARAGSADAFVGDANHSSHKLS
jgi:hypothetical protein